MSYLVIDCGTSACRASVIGKDGITLGQAQRSTPLSFPATSHAEVETDGLWSRVREIVTEVLGKDGSREIEAVGVSALFGYVFLDKQNRPLIPAFLYMDTRAEKETVEIRDRFSDEFLYNRTGRRPSPELLAPRILWLRKHRPEVARQVRRIIGIKDDLVRRLTGEVRTDYAHLDYSLLFDIEKGEPNTDILNGLDIARDLFPEALPATAIVGAVRSEVADELGLSRGTPVISGSTDGTTAMYGGGVLEEGTAVLVVGTTDVLMISSPIAVRDSSRTLSVNRAMVPDSFLVGGATGLGGGTLKHLEGLLSVPLAAIIERIEGLPPGSEGLLLLPGLTGERSPYWKSHVTGALLGLTTRHGPEHIYRAVMEGSALRLRKLLQVLETSGLRPQKLNLVGGTAGIDIWNQIRADVTGLELERLNVREATSLGTAMFCKAALEGDCSLQDIAREWIRVERSFSPNPGNQETYDAWAKLFETFIERADPLFRDIKGLKMIGPHEVSGKP